MDQAGHVPDCGGCLHKRLHRRPRRHVDARGTDLETGIAQDLCRRVGGFKAQVGQQDVLACADAPGDRLTDRSGSDENDNIGHGNAFGENLPVMR